MQFFDTGISYLPVGDGWCVLKDMAAGEAAGKAEDEPVEAEIPPWQLLFGPDEPKPGPKL